MRDLFLEGNIPRVGSYTIAYPNIRLLGTASAAVLKSEYSMAFPTLIYSSDGGFGFRSWEWTVLSSNSQIIALQREVHDHDILPVRGAMATSYRKYRQNVIVLQPLSIN